MSNVSSLPDANDNDALRQKFIKGANLRVNKVVTALELVAELSDQEKYSYNADDVQAVLNALHESVATVTKAFEQGGIKKAAFSIRE